jgi:hypothetical protein
VEANSDLNLAGKDGATPLFVAAQILGRAIFGSLACLHQSLKMHHSPKDLQSARSSVR